MNYSGDVTYPNKKKFQNFEKPPENSNQRNQKFQKRKIYTQKRQQDIDQKVRPTPFLHQNTDRRQENGQDYFTNVRTSERHF